MGRNHAGFDLQSVQDLRRFAVVETVETAPERLPIEHDAASRRTSCSVPQTSSVAAKDLLDRLRIEALEDVANGGMDRCTLPMQAEGGVQPAAVHSEESFDGTEGIASGDHGEDGERQNMGQLVELAFGSTWVGDLAEHGEKLIERPHGNLLAVRLPDMDSKISPRRNPAIGVGAHILSDCCSKDSPLPHRCIEG